MKAETLAFLNHYATPVPEGGCWLWTGCVNTKGYALMGGKQALSRRGHRTSYILENGSIPDGMIVCHRCDVPSCVNPAHLFLGTNATNSADMVAKHRQRLGPRGTPQRGEMSGAARLTNEQVLKIRNDWRSSKIIAAEYGVSRSHICGIRIKTYWRHL